MWLSQKIAEEKKQRQSLQEATVSVGGENPGVLADAEYRDAAVISPGGYEWRPAPMERVFACRADGTYILGKVQQGAALAPGQIRLSAGAARVTLSPDGSIELEGRLIVNGKEWEEQNEATFG